MRRFAVFALVVMTTFAIAACSNSSSPAATSGGGASAPAASGGGGGAACATGEGTATVTVEIKDFKFNPDPVTASVGDVISWTNGDSAPHTATLDDGTCDTGNINEGASGLLVFNQPGTYAYHCNIHSQMKGTITVS